MHVSYRLLHDINAFFSQEIVIFQVISWKQDWKMMNKLDNPLLSILPIDNNFLWDSIFIDYRYQLLAIGDWRRLVSFVSIDLR